MNRQNRNEHPEAKENRTENHRSENQRSENKTENRTQNQGK